MSHIPHSDDPKVQAYFEKLIRRDRRTEHFFRRILHILERLIAAVTLIALVGALGLELVHMFTGGSAYFANVIKE